MYRGSIAEEVMAYVRSVLSESEGRALSKELKAAETLPPHAQDTAIAVALAKYPQARRVVRELANPMRDELRGEWLSSSDWSKYDLSLKEDVDEDLVETILSGAVLPEALNWQRNWREVRQAILRLRAAGIPPREISIRLNLDPGLYEDILRRMDDPTRGS
jgi:hypothetical protein